MYSARDRRWGPTRRGSGRSVQEPVGNVAPPGVKDPLRRKQREDAIFAYSERVERCRRCSKDYNNRKKRKRTVNSSIGLPESIPPSHRESTYFENVGRVIEGSPWRPVAHQHGHVSPVTPTRAGFSRRLAPLGPMTDVAAVGFTTLPKLPLDGKCQNLHWFSNLGKETGIKSTFEWQTPPASNINLEHHPQSIVGMPLPSKVLP
jgi:hypothetical protein